MSDTFERIKKIVVEHLEVDAEKVTMKADLMKDLDADSLDAVEVVMKMEEEFRVDIPDDAAENLATVGDIVKFVDEQLAAAA